MVVRGSACRAAIWTSRRSTPASKLVTNVCRNICRWVRAIRAAGLGEVSEAAGGGVPVHPFPRMLSRIGPADRPPTARSIPRPTAGGRGIRTTLVPLPHTRSTRWPCSSPRSAMLALVASKMRRPSSPSIATRAKSDGLTDSRLAVSMASNCRCVKPRVATRGAWRPPDMLGGRVVQRAIDHGGPVEARDDRESARDRGRLEVTDLLHPPDV